MLKNYLIVAFRQIWRNKAYSFINIVGFAFAISVCLGVGAYLAYEYSFDRYHTNANRIYRLIDTENNTSSIDYRVKDLLTKNYPEVESAALFQLQNNPVPLTIDNKGTAVTGLASVDNGFFQVFTVPFLLGDDTEPFQDINSAILTESAAQEFFGDANPIGRVISVWNRDTVVITGVIRDFPNNSSIRAKMFVNAENENFKFSISMADGQDLSTYRWPFRIYVQLNEGADATSLAGKVNGRGDLLQPYVAQTGFLPLADLYLHDPTSGSNTIRGNPNLLRLLLSVGLIILVLAVINYVNLASAQLTRRYREVGVKKSIGATRGDLLWQFLTESILVVLIASGMALVFLDFSMPIYRTIFQDGFNLDPLLQYGYLIVLAVILIGLFSGLGTSYVFTSMSPVLALKGKVVTGHSRMTWRNGLTVFQFMVSVALIVSVIVMQQQIRYVKVSNHGFNDASLLKVDVPGIQSSDVNTVYRLLDRWHQNSGISNISLTNGVPGQVRASMGAGIPGKTGFLSVIYADSSFLSTFGIEVNEGRTPAPGDFGTTALLNEAAYEYFEWTDLENRRFNNGREGGFEVIGVVNDFHYASFKSPVGPMAILLMENFAPTNFSLKIEEGQVGPTLEFLNTTWNELLPQYNLQYEFYDVWLDAMYREDEKLGTAIALFATLAVVISCMGILGMVVFSTQRRTKEIGIRKVLGASVAQIVTLLSKEYLFLVIVANVIGWPIAWYAMSRWLSEFAYRIDLGPGVFLMAGSIAILIALATVSWQSVRSALANPVKSLRSE